MKRNHYARAKPWQLQSHRIGGQIAAGSRVADILLQAKQASERDGAAETGREEPGLPPMTRAGTALHPLNETRISFSLAFVRLCADSAEDEADRKRSTLLVVQRKALSPSVENKSGGANEAKRLAGNLRPVGACARGETLVRG